MSGLVEYFRRLGLRLSARALKGGAKRCPTLRAGCRPELLEPRLLLAGDITQVGYFPTWDGSAVKSTDPAGIAYHAPSGHLFIADSEIDQTRYFTGKNIFEVSRAGDQVFAEYATGNREPTGITYSEFDGYFYLTNDDERTITRYDASFAAPLATVKTRSIDGDLSDPEGITSDPAGNLYIISGKSGEHGVWIAAFDANLQYLYKFSLSDRMSDAEGIAYHPTTRHLFVVSAEQLAIFEYALDGTFIEKYDISGFSPTPITPQGLAFGPTFDPHDEPGAMALYIADGGVDEEPDGRVYVATISGVKSLGTVDYRVLPGLQPWAGEVWYSFQTAHTAILTVQSDNPQTRLSLFDASLNYLTTSTATEGRQRLDYATDAGQEFLVQLVGAGRDVELRIANLVQFNGTSVTIHGTPQDDQFAVRAAAGNGFTVNGLAYAFAEVASFSFDGAGGNDIARLHGSPRANTFTAGGAAPAADPRQATLAGNGVSISVVAEHVLLDGRRGENTATVYDSTGEDLFQPFWKWTQMSGQGYFRKLQGFRSVVRGSDNPANQADSGSGESLSVQTASSQAALADAVIEQAVQQNPHAVPLQDLVELFWLSQAAQPEGQAEPKSNSTAEIGRIDLLFADEP